jgi:transcriptional regulator with XRE-family HTH domain
MSFHAVNYQNTVKECQQFSVSQLQQNYVMTLAERLKAARKAAKLTQTELAHKAGLRWQSLVGNVEAGEQDGTTHIAKFAKVLNVSPLWLETGEGPRELAAREPSAAPYFPDDESRLLRAFRLASPELRRSMMRQADGILDDLENPSQLTGNDEPGPG